MNTQPKAWSWPDLREPNLVERLEMGEEAFLDLWLNMVSQFPPREFSDVLFEVGSNYPWPRPESSFLLTERKGKPLAEFPPDEQASLITDFTDGAEDRTPILAIGSNASPEGLWRKFGHFERSEDRTLLALNGYLHDFDVVAAAEITLYGAMPATLTPSPGTRVNAMTLWLTQTQLTQLAWAEIPYWLGNLGTRFEFEQPLASLGLKDLSRSLVFVNRFGAFVQDEEPFALMAVPAKDRRFRALTQVELLTRAAALVIGPGSTAEELVGEAFGSPEKMGPLITRVLRSNSVQFESDRWTPFRGESPQQPLV